MKAKCINISGCCLITHNREYEVLEENEYNFLIMNDSKNKCWYSRRSFEIIPDKILITDQMIKDFFECVYDDAYTEKFFNEVKINLKQKGYAVEEPKTKLDEARKYKLDFDFQDKTGSYFKMEKVHKKIDLYEAAIEELKKDGEK
jgi:hypothetical protein